GSGPLSGGALPLCFFFSSRRRHTRCLSDWSSDVCSSDLLLKAGGGSLSIPAAAREVFDVTGAGDTVVAVMALALAAGASLEESEIGRASCRERVEGAGVGETQQSKGMTTR